MAALEVPEKKCRTCRHAVCPRVSLSSTMVCIRGSVKLGVWWPVDPEDVCADWDLRPKPGTPVPERGASSCRARDAPSLSQGLPRTGVAQ